MRATRIILFATLAAVVAASIALAVVSNVSRGPAMSFVLVPTRDATNAELVSDAAAMVRRLQSLGFKDTQSRAGASSIVLTMYGSAPKLRAAVQGALAAATLNVRPVVCAAPELVVGGATSKPGQPACATSHVLTAGALKVDTDTGQPTRQVGPDPALASTPSTTQTRDVRASTVLLNTGSASGFAGMRLVAGPAEVVNSDVISASASHIAPNWNVDLALTTSGAKKYAELTRIQFHAYVAVDIDGTVISAPLIEPSSTSFASLGAKIEISAGFTMNQAVDLADDLASPLVVPLELQK